jgi:hypothetical protein
LEGPDTVLEEEDDEGNVKRKEGWWDVLPLMARARLTDLRKKEYLDKGLMDFLGNDRWQEERSTDRESEIYTRRRLEEHILPIVREQVKFFDEPFTATRLSEDALRAGTDGVAGFLSKLSDYWTGRFEQSFPDTVGATLQDVYDQLQEWEDKKSDLRRVCTEIDTALYDLTDIEGNKDDPLLEATFASRREIFETFVVCFNPNEGKVSQHATVTEASRTVSLVVRELQQVAGRGMGIDQAAARRLVGNILTGTGRAPALGQIKDVVRDFRNESGSKPAALLADRLELLMRNAWDGLVKETAENINSHWSTLVSEWRISLQGNDPQEFKRIFAERGSEMSNFERDYITPFFRAPNHMPIETDGATLVLKSEVRSFITNLRSFGTSIFGSGGSIRSDTMEVGLKISGNGPDGLVVHYQSSSGTKSSEERRTDEVPVSFKFQWTPTTCESFSMEVSFRGNAKKVLPRVFTGKWAVAEALASANQVSGNTFIWRGDEPSLGDWEIQLTFTSGGPGSLFALYQKTGGQDPLAWIVSKLPESVVEVRERGR